jgi:type I restriction enzyme, S subunit
MNAQLLISHFGRISDAPGAVLSMRRFILDLAVRGKLVAQDPKETTASELHALVKHNRASLMPNIGWVSSKVGSLLEMRYGKGLDAAERKAIGIVPVFGSNGVVGFTDMPLTTQPTIIIGRKGSAGAIHLCDGPSWTTDVAYFLIPPAFFDIEYLRLALETLDLGRLGKGVKPGLSRSDAYDLPIAVPPLAEQRRIVHKVDELMILFDQLEAANVIKRSRQYALAASALHHLTNGADATASRKYAQFYLEHLPEISTRPEQIPAMRQAILSLAVQGKLVQQNPANGSSESLLSTVHKLREKAANRSKNSSIDDSDPKFVQHLPKTLPPGWAFCPLEELFRFIDYRGRTPTRTPRGVRLITAKNVRMGRLSNDPVEFIDEDAYKTWMSRGFPKNGDILFVTEGATMGFVATIDLPFAFALAQRTIDLQPYLVSYSRFLFFTLMSPIFQGAVLTNSTGTAVKGIKAAKLKRIRVPLPPLAEQERIVARVDELMALCDRLEMQLKTAETQANCLVKSVLHRTLQDEARSLA